MARQYYERTNKKYGYKGLTQSGKNTFWILLAVFYAIVVFVCIYFFLSNIQKSYFLLTHPEQLVDITAYFHSSLGIIIIFLGLFFPYMAIVKIEPSLPHHSYKETYYKDVYKYFCTGCGNYLGDSKPVGLCSNCGSNRWSNEDPGAGRTVRHK